MKKLLLASVAALGLASAAAWAGMNVTQKDTGGVCFEFTSGVTQTEVYCWSALGVLDVAPATTAADSAATNDTMEIAITTPVDTTGTNTHNMLTLDMAVGNATGGTNAARGLQIDAIAGDAQVSTTGINIGAMTGTGGTENALVIGTGWDLGISSASPFELATGGLLDVNGIADGLVLDADADTTLSAPTDDQIDIEINGADDFTITANAFNVLSGSSILVATGGLVDINGIADGLVIDADADTTISADTDDQLNFEVNSDDVVVMSNDTGAAHAYVMNGTTTHQYNRNVFSIFDDFLSQTQIEADGPWIENKGTDAEALDPAIEATSERGVITLVTGDAGTGVAADGTQIISHIPAQADSGGLVFEARLHIDTAVTDLQICVGFTDVSTLENPFTISGTTITAVADDAVAFCYDTAQTTDEWYFVGVDSTVAATGQAITGVVPVADTYQTIRIEIDSDGATARGYINGTLEGTLTAGAVTNTVNLFPTIVADSTTTTSKAIDVDYIYFGHTR